MDADHGHSEEEIAARISGPGRESYVKDTVYGAIDGTVTTFAIVAGVAGAGLSPAVIIALGLANVLADGFSMAAGNYSGTKAERDDIRRLRDQETRHIERNPDGERAELRAILSGKGLSGDVLEAATDAIAANRKAWIDTMMEGEYGFYSERTLTDARAWPVPRVLAAGTLPLCVSFGAENDLRRSRVHGGGVLRHRALQCPAGRSHP